MTFTLRMGKAHQPNKKRMSAQPVREPHFGALSQKKKNPAPIRPDSSKVVVAGFNKMLYDKSINRQHLAPYRAERQHVSDCDGEVVRMDNFQQHTAAFFTRLWIENALDRGDLQEAMAMSLRLDELTLNLLTQTPEGLTATAGRA